MPFLPKEHRDKTELKLQLCDLNSKEDYSVWDNTAKTFIREGQLTDIEGKVHELTATRWMPKVEFERLFPNKGKANKVLREVMVDGEIFTYSMPISVDTGIKQNIATITALGGNPLAQIFVIKKTGQGLQTRYEVTLDTTPQAPQPQVQAQPIAVTPQVTPQEEIVLNDVEKQLVDSIKAKATEMGVKFTFDQVKENFVKYNVTLERAQQVFNQELI
jgi:hypothetical protein